MTTEELLAWALEWRGIEPENACTECGGSGWKPYPTTATWSYGVGGSTITVDVCDRCWGSGDRTRVWTSHRFLRNRERSIAEHRDPSPRGDKLSVADMLGTSSEKLHADEGMALPRRRGSSSGGPAT
jgi:hypothetical protein